MVQLIENNPVSLYANSAWIWASETSVESETNARIISDRVKELMLDEDLSTAVTFDYQEEKELWVNVADRVYIYNYGNDTWYLYDSISAKGFFRSINKLHYYTDTRIKIIGGTSDDGVAVNAVLELGFTDFGENSFYKNTRKLWVTIEPDTRTTLGVNYETDRDGLNDDNEEVVEYYFLDFNNIDFNAFSFLTNDNPKGERLKIRAKKYQYIRFIFTNNKLNETLTILNFNVQAELSGEVK
jgi:hypothetical protein